MRPSSLFAVTVLGIALATAGPAARQLQTPTDWKVRTDTPAAVTNQSGATPDRMFFVGMPPGWHMTTGPGVLIHHPDYAGKGQFGLTMDVFLFADSGDREYGVFVGGQNVGPGQTSPAYTAFVLRRDGHAAVLRTAAGATTRLVDWTLAPSAVALAAGATGDVKNTLAVDVGPVDVTFAVNGKDVIKVPRVDVQPEGALGFRVGAGMNLHVSQLAVAYKLAPVRR